MHAPAVELTGSGRTQLVLLWPWPCFPFSTTHSSNRHTCTLQVSGMPITTEQCAPHIPHQAPEHAGLLVHTMLVLVHHPFADAQHLSVLPGQPSYLGHSSTHHATAKQTPFSNMTLPLPVRYWQPISSIHPAPKHIDQKLHTLVGRLKSRQKTGACCEHRMPVAVCM